MFMVLMVYFMILSDYDATAVNDILDIPKYLLKKKKYNIKMFGFIKIMFVVAISFFS